ncbi:exported protein of unknown function [Candidatus Hydrogenisulfobacillus filiaventi]|uniref:SCP domain-containing protein n=1 Tax=Candidatus Hydrogenisulfobacillus filiaventi TaxID=2707344 RepID=A0A6F8ZD97_9FIRM|nr:cell wall-binding repeat-containing protein [Bacillota bacterium]CAB1127725.1 exported protein of unknown function [Candidatus Hydrogenisulfobacillus filiaventi]
MAPRRTRPLTVAAAVLAALLLPAPVLAAGLAHLPDPAANLAPDPDFWPVCEQDGWNSTGCTAATTAAIDHARAAEGLGPLVLPRNWAALDPVQQLFVLANLERVARGLTPVPGLSATLDQAAQAGAAAGTDPQGPGQLSQGQTVEAWASNWAQAPTPLIADYYWMYDDGYGGPGNTFNIDCTSPGADGCWGHRNNILTRWSQVMAGYGPYRLAMGAGAATLPAGPSFTQLFAVATPPHPAYVYTWAQALAAGAASPQGWDPVAVTVPPAGPGRVAGADRAATALALAQRAFPAGAATAVLAPGDNADLLDALVAGPLAAALQAPILLTDSPGRLNPSAAAGLSTLGVTRVYLVGADANPVLAGTLHRLGYQVREVGDTSPYTTAGAVAGLLQQQEGGQAFHAAFLVDSSPAHLVDALAAGPAAAALGTPILPVVPAGNGSWTLPAPERPYVSSTTTVYQVGRAAYGYVAGLPPATFPVALAGNNRFQTAALVDRTFFPDPRLLVVANGTSSHLVDALTAAPWVASRGGALVLVDNGTIPASTAGYLGSISADPPVRVLGGPASIPAGTGARIAALAGSGS